MKNWPSAVATSSRGSFWILQQQHKHAHPPQEKTIQFSFTVVCRYFSDFCELKCVALKSENWRLIQMLIKAGGLSFRKTRQNSHGQSTDVSLVGLQQVDCGECPVLAHHVWNLSREVAGGCRKHLPYIGRPCGSLITCTVDIDKTPLEQVSLKSILVIC